MFVSVGVVCVREFDQLRVSERDKERKRAMSCVREREIKRESEP